METKSLTFRTLLAWAIVCVGHGSLTIPAVAQPNILKIEEKLNPNPLPLGSLGASTAISGNTVVVGAPILNILSSNSGAVYIYTFSGTNNVQQQQVLSLPSAPLPPGSFNPPPVPAFFGTAVDIDNNLLVVGSVGKAFVYGRNGTTWSQQAVLSDGAVSNVARSTISPQSVVLSSDFGVTLGISGQTVVVGAPAGGTSFRSGEVYVFVRHGSDWSLQASLIPSDNRSSDQFGHTVAISGNTLIAAKAPPGDVPAVYVYVRSGTNWTEQQTLAGFNSTDLFGSSLAIDGDTAFIGAPREGQDTNSQAGAVYVYHRSGTTWSLQQTLVASDVTSNLFFGEAVAIRGNRAVVGAPGHGFHPDVVYVFEFDGSSWVERQIITGHDTVLGDDFGTAVDIDTTGAIVGAPAKPENGYTGAAYLFPIATTPAQLTAIATPNVLRPFNHKLIPVMISVLEENNENHSASCHIVSVTSNEPINGRGDGNTEPDWVITGDLTLLLRAERSGNNKSGRVYTITIECTETGGTTTVQTTVTVPHDNSKR